MRAIRILHPCRPRYDNLGEVLANDSVRTLFRRRGVEVELDDRDLWDGADGAAPLDRQIDAINSGFDLMMIGPGGFLGPRMINGIFSDLASWERLSIPLCFNGVGIVASAGRPVWYSALGDDSHALRALDRACAVSTRELNSWLLAARAIGDDPGRLMLAGCPSLWTTRATTSLPKTHDLALNLSFTHEVCRLHLPALLRVAQAVSSQGMRVLCICHSRLDAQQAAGINSRLSLGLDIVQPLDAAATTAAYGACRMALVTRFHAGIFCLANAVPFGFIGYDMKCWHLLTMLADEPYQYVLPIDRLAQSDVALEVERLLLRIGDNSGPLRSAQRLLLAYFDRQTDRFLDVVLAAVR